jgi:hypothetical protein
MASDAGTVLRANGGLKIPVGWRKRTGSIVAAVAEM